MHLETQLRTAPQPRDVGGQQRDQQQQQHRPHPRPHPAAATTACAPEACRIVGRASIGGTGLAALALGAQLRREPRDQRLRPGESTPTTAVCDLFALRCFPRAACGAVSGMEPIGRHVQRAACQHARQYLKTRTISRLRSTDAVKKCAVFTQKRRVKSLGLLWMDTENALRPGQGRVSQGGGEGGREQPRKIQ